MDTSVMRVRPDRGPYGEIIRAVTPIDKGETVFHLTGKIISYPTKYSIQLDGERHVLTVDDTWKLMNHGCAPNVRIDTDAREMVAERDIAAGEELLFNYNSTEWSMTSSFMCGCGAPGCAGEVRGFKYLSEAQREAIRPFLSPYILRRWRESLDNASDDVATYDIRARRPEVQVLIPYESLPDGRIQSPQYDTPEFRAEAPTWFSDLGLDWVWRPVTLQGAEQAVAELVERAREREIVVLNLCDGTENDMMPGKTVVRALEASGLPFTGATADFYINTTSKLDTKRLLAASGVPHAPYVEIKDDERDLALAVDKIGYPLFIKPDVSAGSWGIHLDSVCYDLESARKAVARLRGCADLSKGAIFAEPFIEGREFTCLVMEDAAQPLGLWVLPPAERVFDKRAPSNERFLAYERYWGLPEATRPIPEGEPYYWYELAPADVRDQIASIARRAMRAVDGSSYARIDLRRADATGEIFVLEVNSQCGLSDSDDATVGSMLKLSGVPMSEIVERILTHAMMRKRELAPA